VGKGIATGCLRQPPGCVAKPLDLGRGARAWAAVSPSIDDQTPSPSRSGALNSSVNVNA
jgi:hypothetical protein